VLKTKKNSRREEREKKMGRYRNKMIKNTCPTIARILKFENIT
jgi:hypothetical protein